MNLHARYTALQAAGRLPVYCYQHALVDAAKADNVQIQLGLQPSGRYLYMADLDSHKEGQDADAAWAAFAQAEPEIARKLPRIPTRRGIHAFFESYQRLDTGKLYDGSQHIGELLGDDSHTADPGDIAIPMLTQSETERMFSFWTVQGTDVGGRRWRDRAKQGKKWTAGYTRIQVTRAQLRAFLQTDCGRIGITLDALFDEHKPFNRSDVAGNLMQTLMLFAHKLPCGWGAPFHEKCRWVMAYWMAADSYGKAGEKGYTQERDGHSLIAQIVKGDRLDNGKTWTCPFWAKGQGIGELTTPDPTAPAPAPAAPAHRPSDQVRRLARLRKTLEAIAPDDFGRRIYFNDDLAERLRTAPRTLQADIAKLREDGEIVTAQISGNGAPYAVLTCHFGGARSTAKACKPTAQLDIFGGASPIAVDGAGMPQTDDRQPVCIKEEDHHNSSAPSTPPPAPAGARPAGAQACGDPLPAPAPAGASIEALIYRDALALAACWSDMPGTVLLPGMPESPPPPPPPLGKFTFGDLGWRGSVRIRQRRKAGPVKQERFTGRDEQMLSAKYLNRKRHGTAPEPAPVRKHTPLPLEELPELCVARPAPADGGIVERLRALKAQRESAT